MAIAKIGPFRQFWRQSVWGDSRPAACRTVAEYKKAIAVAHDWTENSPANHPWNPANQWPTARWEAIKENLIRYHSDQGGETSLIASTFNRQGVIVTLFALLAAFGFDRVRVTGNVALLIPSGVFLSLALLVWGMSPRLKVLRKVKSLGMAASTEVTEDPETVCFALYTWLEHRVPTRTAIDRFFLTVCLIANVTIVSMMVIELWPLLLQAGSWAISPGR